MRWAPSGNASEKEREAKEKAREAKARAKARTDKKMGNQKEKGSGKEKVHPTTRTSVSDVEAQDMELRSVRLPRRRQYPPCASWRKATRSGTLHHGTSHGTSHGVVLCGEVMHGGEAPDDWMESSWQDSCWTYGTNPFEGAWTDRPIARPHDRPTARPAHRLPDRPPARQSVRLLAGRRRARAAALAPRFGNCQIGC